MNIRQVRDSDLKHVSKLDKLWNEEKCTYGLCHETKNQLSERKSDLFLVAENGNGIIVGFTIAQVKHKPLCVFGKRSKYLEIQELYVNKKERSKGIGTAFIKELLRLAKAKRVNNISIYSNNKDTIKIIKYYNKFGFKMYGVNMFLKI